jgi:hypothetical protein
MHVLFAVPVLASVLVSNPRTKIFEFANKTAAFTDAVALVSRCIP